MDFSHFDQAAHFRRLWEAVRIERAMPYALFTFGTTELPYYLVVAANSDDGLVGVTKGQVTITRPTILTPDNMGPEFEGFLDENGEEGMVEFLMARGMHIPNMKFANNAGRADMVSDSVEEVVTKLIKRLDQEEEDRVAVLSAPPGLGSVALIRYAIEKSIESAPGNIAELQERGLLP
ncbi:hypothetical protein [Calycomorphotria hydatis]|uniref:Uncharacterized protein n=1 Tax=Calycomorphotria hydatis TaxID=2528027 RepID=A0A517T3G6_9PLAN|nr:hypothetical protein [Calycomorphotria hydatis]QDT62881.1 hypothetical protein V22_00790 [Calycomorphotria hydatis]